MKKEIKNKNKSVPSPDRRRFLKATAVLFSTLSLSGCLDWDEVLQKHFKEMDKDELKAMIERLQKNYTKNYGVPFSLDTTGPMDKTVFGYGLDLSRCIGCRRCVHACVKENNQSRKPEIQWIKVMEMEKEKGVDLDHGNAYYDAEKVPREGHFYMPVSCQQCQNPPCVKTCPVGATWKEPDGIVVVDYDWCIGCRCCMSACPYGARHFNWTKPAFPKNEMLIFSEKEKFQEDLNQGKLPEIFVTKIENARHRLSDKIAVKVKEKGKSWTIHDEKENRYFSVVKNDKMLDCYEELNPNTHYLGNRPRPNGCVEKCTFCIQRVRKGRYPACVEICPIGARKFGNLLDPTSEIRYAIENKRVFIFKEELNTQPSFFYFYSL